MDHSATSWPKPEMVYEKINDYLRYNGASPGRGGHKKSVAAGRLVEQTRKDLANFFNIEDSSRLVFSSNATEAINICLKGILNSGDHVIISSMEHNSVLRPLWALCQKGIELSIIECSQNGELDPQKVKSQIKSNTRLICVLHSSNVTGTILPIKEIGNVAKEHEILFMLDTAQTAGVIPIDVIEFNLDILTFTGHKGLLGLQGTGGFYLRSGVEIRSWLEGGTGSASESHAQPEEMPDKFESGTANTPGIVGLGAGVRFIEEVGLEKIQKHEESLIEALIIGLKDIENVILYGPLDPTRQSAVLSFNIKNVDCSVVSHLLDNVYDISCRAGLHCAPLAHKTIGTFPSGSCRLSPGYFHTLEDINKVVGAIFDIEKMYR